MNTIWKDLLYLHGHLLERDLHWQEEDAVARQTRSREGEKPPLATPARQPTAANRGHCQPNGA